MKSKKSTGLAQLNGVKTLTRKQQSSIVGGIQKSRIKGPASMAG